MRHGCAILLPAAGASTRMCGADKLLQVIGGQTLLRAVAERALQVAPHVGVTLPTGDDRRRQSLEGISVARLPVEDAQEGMAASLRAGARWAMTLDMHALMIVLPDMPDITADDMRSLFTAQARAPQYPLRASSAQGQPGHPVILPKTLVPAMLNLSGDDGAKALLRIHPPRLHPLPGRRALLDLDTPEEWEAWRKAQPSG